MKKNVATNKAAGDNDLYEYLLVANPSSDVNEKVMKEKTCFYDEYKERWALKTEPHITVANFKATKEMEEIIVRQLQRVCSGTPSFSVTLSDYSGTAPHTISLNIVNEKPFKQLAKQILFVDQYIAANDCPPLQVAAKPSITIAGQLSKDKYAKALNSYSRKKFKASFVVNELLLVKRKHQHDKCKPVSTVPFA